MEKIMKFFFSFLISIQKVDIISSGCQIFSVWLKSSSTRIHCSGRWKFYSLFFTKALPRKTFTEFTEHWTQTKPIRSSYKMASIVIKKCNFLYVFCTWFANKFRKKLSSSVSRMNTQSSTLRKLRSKCIAYFFATNYSWFFVSTLIEIFQYQYRSRPTLNWAAILFRKRTH